MTDIEKQALALEWVNQVAGMQGFHFAKLTDAGSGDLRLGLLRVVERFETFRQEVSDAVEAYMADPQSVTGPATMRHIHRFIIAKPDPLVEAIKDCELATLEGIEEGVAHDLRAAIEKRGGKIVWGEG